MGDQVGEGAFGTVRKSSNIGTSEVRAIKTISKRLLTLQDQLRIINEIKINTLLDHPSISSIYEYFVDKENYYMIFQLEHTDLLKHIKDSGVPSEQKASYLFRQLLEAVSYMHS